MPLQVGELYAAIEVDQSKFNAGLQAAENKFKGFGKNIEVLSGKIRNIGMIATAGLTLPIVGAATASFKLASDMTESLNKVDVAFKGNAEEVKSWATSTLMSFGLAKGTALDMAAGYGDMATSMGLTTGEASKMSTSLVGLAGDLASFKNIGIDEANLALTAIFTGETESLKRLGIVMTQQNIDEWAATQGIKKKITAMSQAEQVQTRYAYVMAMTSNAQGDFARTQGGAANQMRIFGEALKELGASFGENLLPVITPIIVKINEMVKGFGKLSPESKKLIMVIAGIVAIGGPVLVILGSLAGAVTAISAAVPVLGAAFTVLMGPVGLVIAGIAALIAMGVLLYKNWDKIKAFGVSMWDAISTTWNNNLAALSQGMRSAGQAIIEIWGKIKGAILEAVAAALRFVGATDQAASVQYEADKAQYIGLADTGKQGGRRGNQSLFGYASGTTSARKGLAWAGENGPELINFGGGETVLNNRQSMAAIQGDYTVTHVFQTNDGNIVKRVAEEFERGNRRIPSRVSTLPSMA